MPKRKNRKLASREDQSKAMIKKAMSFPGIREVMEVYGENQKIEREVEEYWQASRENELIVTTSDHANVQ